MYFPVFHLGTVQCPGVKWLDKPFQNDFHNALTGHTVTQKPLHFFFMEVITELWWVATGPMFSIWDLGKTCHVSNTFIHGNCSVLEPWSFFIVVVALKEILVRKQRGLQH